MSLDPEEIREIAAAVLKNQIKIGYVPAARSLAVWVLEKLSRVRDYDAMLENLTFAQARCTELLEENRKLRGVGS